MVRKKNMRRIALESRLISLAVRLLSHFQKIYVICTSDTLQPRNAITFTKIINSHQLTHIMNDV